MENVNDETFGDMVYCNQGLTLVDFWAEWCGPCRQMIPVLEKVEEKFTGKVRFVKANVDETASVAGALELRSVPTFILLKDGEVKDKKVGVMSEQSVIDWLNSYITEEK